MIANVTKVTHVILYPEFASAYLKLGPELSAGLLQHKLITPEACRPFVASSRVDFEMPRDCT